MSSVQYYHHPRPVLLESGIVLTDVQIAYHTYGQLNAAGDNVIWICHALTANSDVQSWWPGMVGAGCPLDTSRYFVVCANILGSCYGTSAGNLFTDGALPPLVTIRDMVVLHQLLRQQLSISRIAVLIGGSMGGYQALEWVLAEPDLHRKLFLIATAAAESAWGVAIHTAQRLAIEADSTWQQATGGARGLKAARAIGMLVYRSYEQYVMAQTEPDAGKTDHLKASSYIEYQGNKLVQRFCARNYWLLTKSMDSHNISRHRGGDVRAVLGQILQPTLIVGISSDLLSPVQEQQKLATHLPHSQLHIIDSFYGHDGFLTEGKAISQIVWNWLQKEGI